MSQSPLKRLRVFLIEDGDEEGEECIIETMIDGSENEEGEEGVENTLVDDSAEAPGWDYEWRFLDERYFEDRQIEEALRSDETQEQPEERVEGETEAEEVLNEWRREDARRANETEEEAEDEAETEGEAEVEEDDDDQPAWWIKGENWLMQMPTEDEKQCDGWTGYHIEGIGWVLEDSIKKIEGSTF